MITCALFYDEIHRSRIRIALDVVITSAFQTVSPAHARGSVILGSAGHADNGQVATSLRHAFDLTSKFDAGLQLETLVGSHASIRLEERSALSEHF